MKMGRPTKEENKNIVKTTTVPLNTADVAVLDEIISITDQSYRAIFKNAIRTYLLRVKKNNWK